MLHEYTKLTCSVFQICGGSPWALWCLVCLHPTTTAPHPCLNHSSARWLTGMSNGLTVLKASVLHRIREIREEAEDAYLLFLPELLQWLNFFYEHWESAQEGRLNLKDLQVKAKKASKSESLHLCHPWSFRESSVSLNTELQHLQGHRMIQISIF